MEKPASSIIEVNMLRNQFTEQQKILVRGVYELFPHMAELLVIKIIELKKSEVGR